MTMLRTIPAMLGTSLTMLGTTPTMLGTTPTMLGTSPVVAGTTISARSAPIATLPAILSLPKPTSGAACPADTDSRTSSPLRSPPGASDHMSGAPTFHVQPGVDPQERGRTQTHPIAQPLRRAHSAPHAVAHPLPNPPPYLGGGWSAPLSGRLEPFLTRWDVPLWWLGDGAAQTVRGIGTSAEGARPLRTPPARCARCGDRFPPLGTHPSRYPHP